MTNWSNYTNEDLYAGLTEGTLPEEALTVLRDRLYPIILNEAKPYFQKLSWNREDALQEALILIWTTVAKRSFNPNVARGQYHHFFSKAWKNRMISLYRKAIRQPVVLGRAQMGYSSTGEPVCPLRRRFFPSFRCSKRRQHRHRRSQRKTHFAKTALCIRIFL